MMSCSKNNLKRSHEESAYLLHVCISAMRMCFYFADLESVALCGISSALHCLQKGLLQVS